jgi:hypothetical protein
MLVVTVLLSEPAVQETSALDPQVLPITRIEEDWILVVFNTNAARNCPQITTAMAPSPTSALRGLFHLNHRESPNFTGGGIESQAWNGATLSEYRHFGASPFSGWGELMTWTQYMQTDGLLNVSFGISKGYTTALGSLLNAPLTVNTPVLLPDFADYTWQTSIDRSGITYGANRLDYLALRRVRKYNSLGVKVSEEEVNRRVYTSQ